MSTKSLYQGRIKIYADGADRNSILQMRSDPKIQGFTTNPSLMKQAGVKDYTEFCRELLKEVTDKPISFEVFDDDFPEMLRQARVIASWGKNVYVKIPITNSRGESSMPVIRELSHQGVNLNVTAIFTMKQVEETAKAVKGGAPSIISIFAGRISDAGYDAGAMVKQAVELSRTIEPKAEVLWASSREIFNLIDAEQAGCHIITLSPDLLKKMSSFGKDLDQFSLETVQMFKRDAESAGFKL